MTTEDWRREQTSNRYSTAVGVLGDVFQRAILKPYIAAIISSARKSERPFRAPDKFYESLSTLGRVKQLNTEGIDDLGMELSEGDLRVLEQLETHASKRVSGIKKLKILDLGGGEGFIGRWLMQNCSTYILVDASPHLVKKGIKKLKDQPGFETREWETIFAVGDFNDISAGTDLRVWLNERITDKEAFRNKPAEAKTTEDFDFILCLNVIDHLQDPSAFIGSISKSFPSENQKNNLIVSTLNPKFFSTKYSWFQQFNPQAKPERVALGPADDEVDVYQRIKLQYEEMFVSNGYRVVSCDPVHMSQLPDAIQIAFLQQGRLNHLPSSGPFLVWNLRPDTPARPASTEEIMSVIDGNDLLSEMSDSLRQHLLSDLSEVSIRNYEAGEYICFESNLADGVHLVRSGEACVLGPSPQSFGEGALYGELEAGDDTLVSRYLYPIVAGPSGCELVKISRKTFSRLLTEERDAALNAALYKTLRSRLSTFSWIYHRGGASEHDTEETANGVEAGLLSRIARILLLASTMEGGEIRRRGVRYANNDGFMILFHLDELASRGESTFEDQPIVRDFNRRRNKKEEELTAENDALELLSSLGIIEAFDTSKLRTRKHPALYRNTSYIFQVESVISVFLNFFIPQLKGALGENISEEDWARIVAWANTADSRDLLNDIRVLEPTVNDGGVDEESPPSHADVSDESADEHEQIDEAIRGFADPAQARLRLPELIRRARGSEAPDFDPIDFWNDLCRIEPLPQIIREGENGLGYTSAFVTVLDGMKQQINWCVGRDVWTEGAGTLTKRLCYNIGMVNFHFLSNPRSRFVVINDLYFLRRIALGSIGWKSELQNRITGSNNISRTRALRESSVALHYRYVSYLSAFREYCDNYWSKPFLDLQFTLDAYDQEIVDVEKLRKVPNLGRPRKKS